MSHSPQTQRTHAKADHLREVRFELGLLGAHILEGAIVDVADDDAVLELAEDVLLEREEEGVVGLLRLVRIHEECARDVAAVRLVAHADARDDDARLEPRLVGRRRRLDIVRAARLDDRRVGRVEQRAIERAARAGRSLERSPEHRLLELALEPLGQLVVRRLLRLLDHLGHVVGKFDHEHRRRPRRRLLQRNLDRRLDGQVRCERGRDVDRRIDRALARRRDRRAPFVGKFARRCLLGRILGHRAEVAALDRVEHGLEVGLVRGLVLGVREQLDLELAGLLDFGNDRRQDADCGSARVHAERRRTLLSAADADQAVLEQDEEHAGEFVAEQPCLRASVHRDRL